MKYYLVGIKGSGMAALAGILEDDGNIVCGVDIDHEVFTEKELIKRQIKYDTFSNDLKLSIVK